MAVPVVFASELLLQNRGGTEQPSTAYNVNQDDGRCRTTLKYEWTTHVSTTAPMQIQG